jgi:hypothetical protein
MNDIHMMPGETKVIIISANKQWNDTHIMMSKGETYYFESSGSWQDSSTTCDTNGYISTGLLRRLTEWLRRFPKANWFALIGAISHSEKTSLKLAIKPPLLLNKRDYSLALPMM